MRILKNFSDFNLAKQQIIAEKNLINHLHIITSYAKLFSDFDGLIPWVFLEYIYTYVCMCAFVRACVLISVIRTRECYQAIRSDLLITWK